jgi:precorrin-6Y C5,15-methyltransferase (decarboxylating)
MGRRVVVLASGDPNYFGIAPVLYRFFDRQTITVLPHATAFQWAFAAIREPWDDASFISVHGREIEQLDSVLQAAGTFVIYCDGKNSPAASAAYLIAKNRALGACRAWVFDSLGGDHEKIITGRLRDFVKVSATPLAMLVIKNDVAPVHLPLGIADNDIIHQRGMITKRDVRILALARLQLHSGHILWDIGAGSGAVSIEAANLDSTLQVYAVEQDRARYAAIQKNIQKFRLPNVYALNSRAPAALSKLPDPDRIFIGGSGGKLPEILRAVKLRVKKEGRIVITCVTLETLAIVVGMFKQWQCPYEMTSLQLSHAASNAHPLMLRPENPILIAHAVL